MLKARKKQIFIALTVLALIAIGALFALELRRGATFQGALTKTRDLFLLSLEIVGVLLLLSLTAMMFRWLRREPAGTLILAFETVDGGEKENKPRFDGKSISDSLNAELLRIGEVHKEEQDEIESANKQDITSRSIGRAATGRDQITAPAAVNRLKHNMTFDARDQGSSGPKKASGLIAIDRPKYNVLFEGPGLQTTGDKLTPSFLDSVTVGVGGTTVSIGRLLMAFKQLSSNRDPEIVISGSLQRFGHVARLVARIDRCPKKISPDRVERYALLICEVSKAIQSEDDIPALVRDLAYRIWHETSKNWQDKTETSARTWTAFKYFTEALYGYHQYNRTDRVKDLKGAAANCLEALRQEKDYKNLFHVSYNLGRSCFEAGNYATAERLFLGAIRIHEGTESDGEANARLADAYNGYGASQALQDKNADAARAYRQAIKLNPTYRDAYINLCTALAELGLIKAAKRELDNAIALRLLDDLSPVDLGDLYSSLGFTDAAMKTYSEAIRDKPSNGYAHFQLGNLHADLQQVDAAIDEYEQAIDLTPDDASAHNALGVIYDREERYDEAIAQYELAIDTDPEMALPHNNLGIIYDKLGRTDEAIAAYRLAIELDDRFAIAHYNLGLIYSNQGRTKEAIAELEAATKLDDTHASSHEWLAFVYTKDQQLEKAVVETKRALDLDPTNRRLTASLAALYKKLGNEGEHQRLVGLARKQMPPPNEDEYQQASFEALLGNVDEALRLLKIALQKGIHTGEFASNDSDFDFLKDDPRFQELVRAFWNPR